MNDILLTLEPDLSIQISSTQDLEVTDKTKIISKAYLPGVSWDEKPWKSPDLTIRHFESSKRKLEVQDDTIQIYDLWGNQIPLDLWHLSYSVARLQHLRRDRYPIHAACAGTDGHTLLVGHSGTGKTSILLEMILRHGWKVYSGNKTVTSFESENGIKALSGTSTITLASGEEAKYAALGQTTQYSNRGSFDLDLKHYETRQQVDIDSIMLVQLNDGAAIADKLSSLGAMHTLYPYFLDTVNADTVVCNGEAVFSGTPPDGTQRKLAKHLQNTLPSIPIYRIVGSMDFVTNKITEATKK